MGYSQTSQRGVGSCGNSYQDRTRHLFAVSLTLDIGKVFGVIPEFSYIHIVETDENAITFGVGLRFGGYVQ
ncbi:MAG: hypothetical protein ABUK01_05320 [Leptospirales bacterium]